MRALERMLAILEAVTENGAPTSPSVAAEATGLSLSTTSRLMRQLCDEGLLDRVGEEGAYALGSRLLMFSRAAVQPSGLVEAGIPEMRVLRDLTGETVSLHVRRGDSRICIAQVESTHPVRRVVPEGFSAPLQLGATGATLLAMLEPADRDALLKRLGVRGGELKAVRARVAAIEKRDWTTAIDGLVEGLSGLAAPVREADGAIIAALSISGPSSRWTQAAMDGFGAAAQATAKRIAATVRPGAVASF
jgi:DNA-binding IclR family transcriptional regulator